MTFLLVASYADSLLRFRGALIQALLEQGLRVHVAAPNLDPQATQTAQLKRLGVTTHNIPLQRTGLNPLADLQALLALFRLMRQIRPDFVMGYTIKPVIYGSLAAALAGVPHRFALITGLGYAFSGMDEAGHRRSWLQKLVHHLYARALSTTHKVFFQNPDDEALFQRMGLLGPEAKTVVVNGSGVDVSQYAQTPLPMVSGQVQPRFLLIARLLGDKGVREYAQAAAILKARHPQAQFDLVGWIDDNPSAIDPAELDQWVSSGLMHYWGKLADVRPAIAAASVYVLPSYREGTPRTVLEAMAMGRAIITTDAPGCRETVVDGDNGFLVPVKSVEALVQAMARFIQAPHLIASMGQRSRILAEQKYDVHAVNAVMLHEMGIRETLA